MAMVNDSNVILGQEDDEFYDLFDEEFEINDLPDVEFGFEEEDDVENLGTDPVGQNEQTILLTTSRPSPTRRREEVATNDDDRPSGTTTKLKENDVEKKKRNMKPRKKAVDRPKMVFSKEDAIRNASSYVESSLKDLLNHPMYKTRFPLALAAVALATSLLGLVTSPIFARYSNELVSDIWGIVTAGDKKKLKPEAHELVYRQFHVYVICKSTRQQWVNLNESLNLNPSDHVHHFILRTVLKKIMCERNMVDLPEESEAVDNTLDKNIEAVIRYTAGYVPYALHKRYSKVKGETAKAYCAVLKNWEIKGAGNANSFLEYTNGWIRKQTRGGLFHIKDDVYLFFRNLELETRKHLTIKQMDAMPNKDIKSCIMNSISEKQLVHTYWCRITDNKLVGDISRNLLDVVIKLWIKIRTNAFLKVYLDLKRSEGKKISEKSAKALRKDL